MTKANTAVTRRLLITASSDWVCSNQHLDGTRLLHHQPLPLPTTPLRRTAALWTPLEGQPNASRHHVAVVRITPCMHAVEHFGGPERGSREEIRALQVDRRVRSEPPREPEVNFGADVARVTLHPALIVHGGAAEGAGAQTRGRARIGIDLLRRPGRADPAVRAERRREAVGSAEAELSTAITVVTDEAGHVGQQRPVEVVDASVGQDRRPARVIIAVHG